MTNKTEKKLYTMLAAMSVFLAEVQLYLRDIESFFTSLVIVLLMFRIITLLKDEK